MEGGRRAGTVALGRTRVALGRTRVELIGSMRTVRDLPSPRATRRGPRRGAPWPGLSATLALLAAGACGGHDEHDGGRPGSLGAVCECPGDEVRCGPFEACEEDTGACPACEAGLECVAGLCSSPCDPYLDGCPDGFVCTRAIVPGTDTMVSGYWCRPPHRCLAEAGTDGASLMMAREAVGRPCAAPTDGSASIEGTAFTIRYPTPQGALFPALAEDGREATILHIGPVGQATGLPPGQCGITGATLVVRMPCSAARLGTHPVGSDDEVGEVEVRLDAFGVGGRAVSGSLALEGYDPHTLSLCGQLEAFFDDGARGGLSGSFQARGVCGGP